MNRSNYVKLYLKVSGLTARDLSLKLGYGRCQVSNWLLNGHRYVSDYAMNHMILLRYCEKVKRIKKNRLKLERLRNDKNTKTILG